jgi:hypothetical protein
MTADIRKTTPPASPGHAAGPAGYEPRDASAGATLRAGLYILGVMFLVAALLVPAFRFLVRREAREQERPANVIGEAPKAAGRAFPRLVTSEPAALADFRRKEDGFLAEWGWVEKDRGIARMPVTEAMRIVGERGVLPTFPGAAVPGMNGAPAPAPSPANAVSSAGPGAGR